MKKTGIVTNIQRYTIHDGPGIRTEVFLKGCPLRCLWCSNPETQSPKPELGVYAQKCIGMSPDDYEEKQGGYIGATSPGKCVETCIAVFKKLFEEDPQGVSWKVANTSALIVKDNKVVGKNRDLCIDCLECTKVCPSAALISFGKEVTVEEVMEELEKDRPFYNQSGGGVTFSGGDPLVQHEFTLELLKESKKRGFHTCLETEGHAAWPILEKMLPYVDIMLYDIKHMDSEKHREYTGVGNELILKNLRALAARDTLPLIIRTPVVPGYTDSTENMEAMADFIAQLGPSVIQYQLLPYFSLMKEKYEALGIHYDLPTRKPSKGEMAELVELMRSRGIPAISGAYQEIKIPSRRST